jgi:hypothetical protein
MDAQNAPRSSLTSSHQTNWKPKPEQSIGCPSTGIDDKRRGSFCGCFATMYSTLFSLTFRVHAPYVCHIRSARRLTVQPTVRLPSCTPLKLNSRVSGIYPGWRPLTMCLGRRTMEHRCSGQRRGKSSCG